MQLLGLYIHNNRRLLDKKTITIDWNIQSELQLLIGGNGFGKSTLINEFSPLPAIPKHYTKTGIKRIKIEHENKFYLLESNFGKKHKHSFVDLETDENLNPGGTITVQYDLCKRVLGYDLEIHNFLKGKVKLTTMATSARKDFFSRVSDVPIDYAMRIYDSFRTEARNLAGVQKYNKQKVFDETKKLLSDEKKQEFHKEISELKQTISELMEGKFNNHRPTNTNIETLLQEIDKVSTYIVKRHITYSNYSSIAHLETDIQKADKSKALVNSDLKHILDSIETHKVKLDAINSVTEYPTAQLKADIMKLKETVNELEIRESNLSIELSHQFKDHKQLTKVRDHFIENKRDIQEFLTLLPENPRKNLNDDSLYISVNDKLKNFERICIGLENEIQYKIDTIKHLKSHDPVTCKKCDFSFIPGIEIESLPRIEAEQIELGNQLKGYQSNIEACKQKLEELDVYRSKHRQLIQLLDSYFISTINIVRDSEELSLKSYLMSNELFYESPSSLVSIIDKVAEALEIKVELLKKMEDHEELGSILIHREKLGITDEDAQYTNSTVKQLEIDYQHKLTEQEQFRRTYDELSTLKTRLLKEHQQQQYLMGLVKQLNDYYQNLTKTKINQAIEKETTEATMKLHKLTETLTSCSITEGIIEHLETALKQVNDDILIYSKLIEALGPQKGLIGKSLISFTNYFIERMNEVIKAIWQTPLTISPMTITDKGFSYQFKVITYNESTASDDVSEVSEGEAEIIDFAFMLITASCLNLTNYPLLMDEVGKFFKLEHKVRLYDYLKLLTEHGKASTIVLISHFKGTYEALTRADVCRIDPTGLEVLDHENKFFKINKH